jgi:hypothetical protein
MISYQGYVEVSGSPYSGTGYYKFAIVDAATGNGTTNYWANDGTSTGEPAASVSLPVSNGLFDVLLGDTSLGGMTQPLQDSVFGPLSTYLRVWFSATAGGPFQALDPNQRVASAAYALRAERAALADNSALLNGQPASYFEPAIPSGALMFFPYVSTCPDGWSPYDAAQGRAIVGLVENGNVNGVVGTPLYNMEDRSHTHTVDPEAATTSSDPGHSHSADPPVTNSSSYSHGHGVSVGSGQGAGVSVASGGTSVPAWSHYHTGSTTTDSHSHTVDIPSFSTATGGSHAHSLDLPATASSPATTSDVMPYIQILACVHD